MNRLLCIVLMAALFYACSEKSKITSDIIPPDEMGNILFEMNMAEEFVNTYVVKDTTKKKEQEIKKENQKIFLLHSITEKEFKRSYEFYKSNTDIFKTMMDSLNARSQRRRTELYQMPI